MITCIFTVLSCFILFQVYTAFSPITLTHRINNTYLPTRSSVFSEKARRFPVTEAYQSATNLGPQIENLIENTREISDESFPSFVSSSEADGANQDTVDIVKRHKAAIAAQLLIRKHRRVSDSSIHKSSVAEYSQTSIGDSELGSATQIRNTSRTSTFGGKILKETLKSKIRESLKAEDHVDHSFRRNTAPANLHRSVIDSTIQNMMNTGFPTAIQPGRTLLRETMPVVFHRLLAQSQLTVRVAFPEDDLDIAHLRLSVFSDFTQEQVRQYRIRACEVLNSRRMKGASCLVASTHSSTSMADHKIAGSLEISTHEFDGTDLGSMRPKGSILYITEVAVSPAVRKSGIGTKLMKGLDKLAALQNVETIYLHVDVTNTAAIRLYQRAGYQILDSNNPIFRQFTTKLNLHDGATKGRVHYLLHKRISEIQTWIEPSNFNFSSKGNLGFQV